MLYLYDVWVNWFEGEKEGYNVCEYHEWRKSDQIEILEQIPVIFVQEDLYRVIENSLNQLPSQLLELIHKREYIRKGHRRGEIEYASIVSEGRGIIELDTSASQSQIKKGHRRSEIEYACSVSDGRGIIAIDTSGSQIPIKKSRLIPRQEQQVFELSRKSKVRKFNFTPYDEEEQSLVFMDHSLIYGLTRRERQLKKILMIGMEQLKSTDNLNEIIYWLTEWDYEKVSTISKEMGCQQIWEILFDEIKDGWSEAHEEFCSKLVKGNRFLESCWELEYTQCKNKSY